MTQSRGRGQAALKYEVEVCPDGRLEFDVPLAAGSRVVVFVVAPEDAAADELATAAASSLGFWDETMDDEDWNAAEAW